MPQKRPADKGKPTQFVTLRMSREMIAAWEAAAEAAGIDKSLWLRKLIQAKTGVPATLGRGQAGMNATQRAARLATYRATIATRQAAAGKRSC